MGYNSSEAELIFPLDQVFTLTLDLAGPVSLAPGQLYVIEVIQLPTILRDSNDNFIVYGGMLTTSTYAGGNAIVQGVPMPGYDLRFEEGENEVRAVPEPSSVVIAGVGMMGMVGYGIYRRRVTAA